MDNPRSKRGRYLRLLLPIYSIEHLHGYKLLPEEKTYGSLPLKKVLKNHSGQFNLRGDTRLRREQILSMSYNISFATKVG